MSSPWGVTLSRVRFGLHASRLIPKARAIGSSACPLQSSVRSGHTHSMQSETHGQPAEAEDRKGLATAVSA